MFKGIFRPPVPTLFGNCCKMVAEDVLRFPCTCCVAFVAFTLFVHFSSKPPAMVQIWTLCMSSIIPYITLHADCTHNRAPVIIALLNIPDKRWHNNAIIRFKLLRKKLCVSMFLLQILLTFLGCMGLDNDFNRYTVTGRVCTG